LTELEFLGKEDSEVQSNTKALSRLPTRCSLTSTIEAYLPERLMKNMLPSLSQSFASGGRGNFQLIVTTIMNRKVSKSGDEDGKLVQRDQVLVRELKAIDIQINNVESFFAAADRTRKLTR